MLVVRELDRELAFVSRLCNLIGVVRFAKSKPRIFARRGAHVTHRANCRAGADESLSCEKLLPMAAHAGVMIRKIRGVGKVSLRRPRGRQFVTGVAREALVFFRRMQKR